jgi:hypothetical protein
MSCGAYAVVAERLIGINSLAFDPLGSAVHECAHPPQSHLKGNEGTVH